MKWVSLIVLLLLGWLFWPRPRETSTAETEAKSERKLLDREWRSKPDREMTISEMTRWARSLSDQELWREIAKSSEEWLAANGYREWKYAPRLPVILVREMGRREGREGLAEIVRFFREKEFVQIDENEELLVDSLSYLKTNLFFGTFGGWSSGDPEEAISSLVREGDWDAFATRPVEAEDELWEKLMKNTGGSFSQTLAAQRVLREAFGNLAEHDSEIAVYLLIEGGRRFSGPSNFDVHQIVESVLPGLGEEDRVSFLEKVEEIDSSGGWGSILNFPEIWSNEVVEKVASLNDEALRDSLDLEMLLVLARARSGKAIEIVRHPGAPTKIRELLFVFLAVYDHRQLNHFDILPPASRMDAVRRLADVPFDSGFGPIDGQDGGWIPEWEAYHETFVRVVGESAMDSDEKAEALRLIEESRARSGE